LAAGGRELGLKARPPARSISLRSHKKPQIHPHDFQLTADLIKLAAKAPARTRKNSELSEEVAESMVLAPWKNRMASLAKRLKT